MHAMFEHAGFEMSQYKSNRSRNAKLAAEMQGSITITRSRVVCFATAVRHDGRSWRCSCSWWSAARIGRRLPAAVVDAVPFGATRALLEELRATVVPACLSTADFAAGATLANVEVAVIAKESANAARSAQHSKGALTRRIERSGRCTYAGSGGVGTIRTAPGNPSSRSENSTSRARPLSLACTRRTCRLRGHRA